MPIPAPTPVAAAPAAANAMLGRRLCQQPPWPWSRDDMGEDVAAFTLVLWLGCLVMGALGFALPYPRPLPPAPPAEPIFVQPLQVELTAELTLPPDAERPPPDPLAPPPPDALPLPPIAQPIAVAQPSPAVAFALPVEGPTRIVEAVRAEYARPVVTNAPAPAVQPLAFGRGEGRQPGPEYPRAALRQGQEGTVIVRLVVDEDGRVRQAAAAVPSPWPLLNEAALRVVRERWRFRGGPARVYEVAIRFELTK